MLTSRFALRRGDHRCPTPRRKKAPGRDRRVVFEQLEDRRLLSVDLISTVHPSLLSETGNSNSYLYQRSITPDGRYVAFASSASDLVTGDTNGTSDIFVKEMTTGTTTRVSTDGSGTQGNSDSYMPSISADGRYVAFRSDASNLVTGDTNGTYDIFVKDVTTGTITRVSTDSSGNQSYRPSNSPSISADGRYVAFQSSAGNLVPHDNNGTYDIFVKDATTGTITRVSTDSSGNQGNRFSSSPSISADGRYVAFSSSASNLVPGDTNELSDIFVKDVTTGAITRVSTDGSGTQGNSVSSVSSISADGRYVVFQSSASNLVPGDTNESFDVFLKDVTTGAITRASTDAFGSQSNLGSSYYPSITPDGRYVAFHSDASNLVPGDTNESSDAFLKDVTTGAITLVSTDASGTQGNSDSYSPSISADGRYVAFISSASNLVPGDTNGTYDIFVKDVITGAIAVGSNRHETLPQWGGNSASSSSSISLDGRYVAFHSTASNLVPHDNNGTYDVFVKDVTTGTITRVSTDGSGNQGNNSSNYPSISADGRYVAFQSYASNLVTGDSNASYDIFVKDVTAGTITRVSTDDLGNQSNSGSSYSPNINASGRYVAFESSATDLVPGDINGSYDIFVKDLATGLITQVSTDGSGNQGNGNSYRPSISADGRYVAFYSYATDLVPYDTNGSTDIFVKDLTTGAIERVSTNELGNQGNSRSSDYTSISADGRYVAFNSDASNLVPGDTNGTTDVFVKDVTTGTITRVSTDDAGYQGNSGSIHASISAGGRYVAFSSYASNLVPGDTNATWDVFVKDRTTGTTTWLSTDGSGIAGNAQSFVSSISADGRYVAFYSNASNLHPDDRTRITDVFRAFTGIVVPDPDIEMVSAELIDSTTIEYTYDTTGTISQFQVGLYRSADDQFDAGDIPVDVNGDGQTNSDDFQTLTPGDPGRFDLADPLFFDPARPFVLVVADPIDLTSEADEANNVMAIQQAAPQGHELLELLAREFVYEDHQVGDQVFGTGYQVSRVISGLTGFFSLGLTSSIANPILVLRGTQPTQINDVFSDFATEGVGYNQFQANREAVETWLDEVSAGGTLVTLVGHSLGGALAQWFAADYANNEDGKPIGEVVTFNSPGICNSVDDCDVYADRFNPALATAVTHYVTSGDLVSMAGDAFLEGSYQLASFASQTFNPVEFFLDRHLLPVLVDSTNDGEQQRPADLTLSSYDSVDWLNNPFFTYHDVGYFTWLAAAGIAAAPLPAPLPSIPPALLFRSTTESLRETIGQRLDEIAATFNLDVNPTEVTASVPEALIRFGPLQVEVQNLSVRYQDSPEESLRIQGLVVLPQLYNVTADFAGDNYIEIRPNSLEGNRSQGGGVFSKKLIWT